MYRSLYYESQEAPQRKINEQITVFPEDGGPVFEDFVLLWRDLGEFFMGEDGWILYEILSGNFPSSEKERIKNFLKNELLVEIDSTNEKEFWRMFFRRLCIHLLCDKFGEMPINEEISFGILKPKEPYSSEEFFSTEEYWDTNRRIENLLGISNKERKMKEVFEKLRPQLKNFKKTEIKAFGEIK